MKQQGINFQLCKEGKKKKGKMKAGSFLDFFLLRLVLHMGLLWCHSFILAINCFLILLHFCSSIKC